MNASTHEAVRAEARSYFEGASPAHDWNHVLRVERLADRLVQDRADVDESVLELAVYLHDIGRSHEAAGTIDDHAAWGARRTRELLTDWDPDTVDAVCHCIRSHRYSNDVEPETPAARVLCDADNLDAIGAIGIARAFTHGAEFGQPILDLAGSTAPRTAVEDSTSVEHIESKLLSLRDRMYTDAGRRLAADRHAFVETYLERLERETSGTD